MKIKRFNENVMSVRDKWNVIAELQGEVYNAEDLIDGCYNPNDENFKEYTEINREYNDLIIRLRKFNRILVETLEKMPK